MGRKAFYVDTSVCTGCKTCQVACQDKNDLPTALLFRKVFQYGGGSWTQKGSLYAPDGVFAYFVTAACNHCGAPACIPSCAVNAIAKDPDTGIVTIDTDACIGCRSCEEACPYGVPVFDEERGVDRKCDMCQDYVSNGQDPACVEACNQRVIKFGEYDDLKAQYPDAVDALEPLPTPTTGPSLLMKPHKDAQISGSGTGYIMSMPEEL